MSYVLFQISLNIVLMTWNAKSKSPDLKTTEEKEMLIERH